MTFKEAARRRDLTINSIAMDPFTGEIIDPFDGKGDCENKILRATDSEKFLEDPLRALRVAQFISRFDMKPDETLNLLCTQADLSELPGERIFEEFRKLLLGNFPAKGLQALKDWGLLKFFPELQAMVNCPQESEWHPEGDGFTHSLLSIQRAREMTDDFVLLMAVLCHDLGKPLCTDFIEGRLRSRKHEEAGEAPTRSFLNRLRAPNDMIEKIVKLVIKHLTPHHFSKQKDIGPSAFRRLAREMGEVGLTLQDIELVARSDHFGRTTPDAIARKFPAGDLFLEKARELNVEVKSDPDVVMGRHLIELGMNPSPEFGKILKECRKTQDERGFKDPKEILREIGLVKA
jgi:tRNA nucleotidyltransferase (CCA-adding enzyme)